MSCIQVTLPAQAKELRLKYALFDAWPPSSGASGRNAGFLIRGVAHNFYAACKQYGVQAAEAMWGLSEENQILLENAGVRTLRSFQPKPSCLLALSDSEAEELTLSASMMQMAGFDHSLVSSGTDDLWAPHSLYTKTTPPLLGLVNPNDGVVNPQELLALLRGQLDQSTLHNGTRVQRIDTNTRDEYSVDVSIQGLDRALHASRVLVATNAYAPELLPQLRGTVTPHRAQMLAATAMDGPQIQMDYSYYADFGDKYFREGPCGELLLGGCRRDFAATEATDEPVPTQPVQEALESFAGAIFGRELHVHSAWAGTMGFSPDGLPLVGPVGATQREGEHNDGSTCPVFDRVWFAGGFTGHGMSLGYATGRNAVDAMLGDESSISPHMQLQRTMAI